MSKVRLIVVRGDCAASVHMGGTPENSAKTFDIENEDLAHALRSEGIYITKYLTFELLPYESGGSHDTHRI